MRKKNPNLKKAIANGLTDRQRDVLMGLFDLGLELVGRVNISVSAGPDLSPIHETEAIEVRDKCFGVQPRRPNERDLDPEQEDLDARHDSEVLDLQDRQVEEHAARRVVAPLKAQPSLADLLRERKAAYDTYVRGDDTIHYRGASIRVRESEGYSLFECGRKVYHNDIFDDFGLRGTSRDCPLASMFDTIDADCGMSKDEADRVSDAWYDRDYQV